jgi:hypothetical protein
MKHALLALSALALAACSPSAADAPIPEQWRQIDVTATPVALGARRAEHLLYRGGLVLTSSDATFGGLSGLEVLDNNRLIAISDAGQWFEGHLVLSEDGELTGLTEVRTALMRDEDGQPFANKAAGDSEDMTQMPDGRFAVSFEQTQTIRIYDLNRDGPFGAAVAGPPLARTETLRPNVGLEALAALPDGELLVGAEGGGSATTPLWRAPLDAHAPVEPLTGYPPERGYSLTSLDRLPDGGFVALERFYAPIIGARARITRFPDSALEAHGDRLGDVEELAKLAPPLTLDNFEGISAVRMPNGVTRIYIVSDNNFSTRQRTLLLAFDVDEAPAAN